MNQDNSLPGEAAGGADGLAAGQRGILLHPERDAVPPVGLPQPAASSL